MRKSKKLAIGICTFQRPMMLRDCLLAIAKIEPPSSEVVIIIINNDVNSTKDNIEEIKEKVPFPIFYFTEEKKGISYARNRVIEEALKLSCTEIAFIDDDEFPSKIWLKKLWDFYIDSKIDIVTGPVIPIFKTSSIFAKESLYSGKRFLTGTLRPHAFTNNVLFSLNKIEQLHHRFDNQFAHSGGEDEDFFRSAVKKGLRIAWVDEAEVFEKIPDSRLSLKYLLRRNFRYSFIGNKFHRKHYGFSGYLSSIIKGILYLGFALATLPLGIILGTEHIIKCLTYFARGIGWFVGFKNLKLEEYAQIHGQ